MNKKKNQIDIKKLINTDEDFFYCPRLGNSLKKLIDKNPDGVGNERIAKVLLLDENEVQELFNKAIEKIRIQMGLS